MRTPSWRRYLTFWRPDIRADIDDELAFHLGERVEDLTAQGVPPNEAKRRAIAELGDVADVRRNLAAIDERMREKRRRADWLDVARQDVRYALRGIRRSPGFGTMVVATLALGMGANTALFSLADRLFLRQPAGVENPGDLRRLYARSIRSVGAVTVIHDVFGYPQTQAMSAAIADRARTAVYSAPDSMRIGDGDDASVIEGVYAASNFLPLLGARPAFGRAFSADEDRLGEGVTVAVIGHELWQHRFHGDSSVLGRVVTIARQRYTIVGVMPRDFTGIDLEPVDVWLPLATYPATATGDNPWFRMWRSWAQMRVVARVARGTGGASDAWISSAATTAFRRGEIVNVPTHPDTATVVPGPLLAALGPTIKPRIEVAIATRLAGVVAIVLLIACANVANLLLARVVKRRRELAVRVALGVSRARLAAQLLTETLMLALGAGVVAIVIGVWGGALLQRMVLPRAMWVASALDFRVASFALLLAVMTGVLASVWPALRASRPDLTAALKAGGNEGSAEHSRLRTALVVVQAALSVILLVGAGLFVRSLGAANAIDLGFDRERVLSVSTSFIDPECHCEAWGERMPELSRGMQRAREQIARIPGVEQTALASGAPLGGYTMITLYLDGARPAPRLDNLDPKAIATTPTYFATTGMRLVRGRLYTDADNLASEHVVIVNETAARAYWPGEQAIGKCISIRKADALCARVVGVVADSHYEEVVEQPMAGVFFPAAQFKGQGMFSNPADLIVRVTPSEIARVAAAAKRIVRQALPSAAEPYLFTASGRVNEGLRPWRLGASLFTIFGMLALVVSAVGIYSVVSYSVSQRTHEIGVRVALGAGRDHVIGLIMREGLATVTAGVALGTVLSLLLGRLVASMLYGTSARDPIVIMGAAGILLAVAALASMVPSLRATRTDPAIALRAE